MVTVELWSTELKNLNFIELWRPLPKTGINLCLGLLLWSVLRTIQTRFGEGKKAKGLIEAEVEGVGEAWERLPERCNPSGVE